MRWEATYKITTPIFLAGAEQEKTPELRPPSFKGLLRFWFRAVALPKVGDWKEVQKLEKELFGSTDRQSSFFLDLKIERADKIPLSDFNDKFGLIYLGYGLFRNGKQRPYYRGNSIFTLRLLSKKRKITEEAKFLLPLALKALGLFGGAGARSRRGFGSLSLLSLSLDGEKTWKAPTNVDGLVASYREFLSVLGLKTAVESELPDYTAFSGRTKIWIGKTGKNPIDLLDEIGLELLHYRSYGEKENGKYTLPDKDGERVKAEQNFASDHNLIMQFCHTGEIKKHPDRIAFGLPHNYYFSSTRDNVQIRPTGKAGRRASPLFIHIHELSNDSYAAVFSLFPAKFLPEDTKIEISVKNIHEEKARHRKEIDYNEDCIDFQIIGDFMERPVFTQKVVVWP
ncbi:MAG TPA: type III-B CRISPR module RAMP protein Cmr1 [Bacillota bacterium]